MVLTVKRASNLGGLCAPLQHQLFRFVPRLLAMGCHDRLHHAANAQVSAPSLAQPPSPPWGTNADVPRLGGTSKRVVPRGRNHERPFELGPSNPVQRNQRWNAGVRTPKQSEHRRAFRSPSSVQGLILR